MLSTAAEEVVPLTSDGDDRYLKVLINNENAFIRIDVWAACRRTWKGEPRQRQRQSPRHAKVLRLRTVRAQKKLVPRANPAIRRCWKTLMS